MNKPSPDHRPDRLAGLRRWSVIQAKRVRRAARWTSKHVTVAPWKLVGIGVGGAFGVAIAALVLFVTFADWNALRDPIARLASNATGREIQITGDLKVNPWSWTPQIRVKGLRIANPGRVGNRGPFANVADADPSLELFPLLIGPFKLLHLALP